MSVTTWTQNEALRMCFFIEEIAPDFGCHVALTGGCLYKAKGPMVQRKDLDILLYRIRQIPEIDLAGLSKALNGIGIEFKDGVLVERWCNKATYYGRDIDFFLPEIHPECQQQYPEDSGDSDPFDQ